MHRVALKQFFSIGRDDISKSVVGMIDDVERCLNYLEDIIRHEDNPDPHLIELFFLLNKAGTHI